MQTCVGAVSRRVVEVAAELKVPQIIASRRQVNRKTGYTGLTSSGLVRMVRELSNGETRVVRDHGGPGQDGTPLDIDDDTSELVNDLASGFDIVHIDVSKLPAQQQQAGLIERCRWLTNLYEHPVIEVGGEHDSQSWNVMLLDEALATGITIDSCIIETGGWIREDRQAGYFAQPQLVNVRAEDIRRRGVKTKAHNQDWTPLRRDYVDLVDYCNIAPEFGAVEIDALLTVLHHTEARAILRFAYESGRWGRWFPGPSIGTPLDHAKCALRYCLTDPRIYPYVNFPEGDERELYVKEAIRYAIERA